MKNRIVSLLLAVAMLLSMATAVFATGDPTVTVASVAAEAGKSVNVALTLSGNTGIAGARLAVTYDSALTLTGITAGEAFSGLTFTEPGDLTANPVNLFWDGQDADSTNGTIVTLAFTVDANAAEGAHPVTVTYTTGEVYDGSMQDVTLTVVNGGVTVEAPAPSHTPGDINGDNKVNGKDVTRLAQYVAGWSVSVVEAALNVNGDAGGKVNGKDVTRLAQYVAGWDVEIY